MADRIWIRLRCHRLLFAICAALGLALLPPTLACVGGQYESVHFNTDEPDFGTIPRRASLWEGRVRPMDMAIAADEDLRDNARQSARAYVRLHRWEQARRAFEWGGTRFGWRGNDRDRWELLVRAGKPSAWKPGFRAALQAYMEGMALCDTKDYSEAGPWFEQVYRDPSAGFLRVHALYQLASVAYYAQDYSDAIKLYEQMIREFPSSPKREAALIMIARCAILPEGTDATRIAVGRNAIRRLERAFPNTRYRQAIARLEAHVFYVKGQFTESLRRYLALDDLASVEIVREKLPAPDGARLRIELLARYLRRLAVTSRYSTYTFAVRKIDEIRRNLTSDEALRFSRRLLTDSEVAAAYLYYRLYHDDPQPADLHNLSALARRVLATPSQRGGKGLSPLIRVRLAEITYQQKQYAEAARWAGEAVEGSAREGVQDRALYVRGASRQRLGRKEAALRDFETLMRRFPNTGFRNGVREQLAILYEAVGDLENALDQYFLLGYNLDAAYLLDVRMSIPQIEMYLRRHPDRRVTCLHEGWYWRRDSSTELSYSEHELLAYTLGIRYMRIEKWRVAAQWFRRVPRDKYRVFSQGRKDWEFSHSPDPLSAIRDLGRLHRATQRGRTENERAMALYRYASYYYSQGELLLYNPVLWKGMRERNFGGRWNTQFSTRADLTAIRTYMYEHEGTARCHKLCLEVVRRYPRTPVVPQALYRAACAAHRMADFNSWWRYKEAKHRDLEYEAINLLKRVAVHYPNHPLAAHAQKYCGVFERERLERWARRTARQRLAARE